MATMEATGFIEGERVLYACIGASIVVHVLAMLYAPKVEPLPPPVTQFKATLRSTPAAPEPAKAEPVVEKPPVVPPRPLPAVKPVSIAKPLPDKALSKTAPPPPVPTAAAPPTPTAAPQPAAAPTPSAAATAPAPVAAEVPKAASPGSSTDPSEKSLIDGYQAQLAQVAAKYKRYPNEAMQNNWEGAATVRLRIGADGKIAAVEIVNSAGQAILDEQASITVNKAKPFVQIPAGLRGKEFVASIRIVFSLKN